MLVSSGYVYSKAGIDYNLIYKYIAGYNHGHIMAGLEIKLKNFDFNFTY